MTDGMAVALPVAAMQPNITGTNAFYGLVMGRTLHSSRRLETHGPTIYHIFTTKHPQSVRSVSLTSLFGIRTDPDCTQRLRKLVGRSTRHESSI